jgi:probable rRNA maturation factor
MPTRTLAITNRHPRLQFERRAVRKAMAALDAHAAAFKVPSTDFLHGELSVVFLTDAALADLHAEFLDDATTTDVIRFASRSIPRPPTLERTGATFPPS